jgi:hypothetical protein
MFKCASFLAAITMIAAGTPALEGSGSLWRIEFSAGQSFAMCQDLPSIRLPLDLEAGGNPSILSWKVAPTGGSFRYVLTYEAGEIGTSEKATVVRALVYDTERAWVLVDEILEYRDPQTGEKLSGSQPEWTWAPSLLTIKRSDGRRTITVPLRNAAPFSEPSAIRSSMPSFKMSRSDALSRELAPN